MDLQSVDNADSAERCDVVVMEFTIGSENSAGHTNVNTNNEERKTFLCPVCNHSFMARGSVYKHIRLAHNTKCSAVKKNGTVKCQENSCDEYVQSIEQLRQHLAEKHQMQFLIETLVFTSYSEFSAWKSQMELHTKSSFSKIRGDKKMKHGHVEKYWCNRSGFYTLNSTKHRRVFKRRSSCKIGGHCTATLTVHVDDMVSVEYCSTHYNHATDLEFLPIPSHVLTDIANDLQNGKKREEILDTHKTRTSTDDVNRSHLLTLKDIYNVEQRLRSLKRHKDECQECPTPDFLNAKCKRARTIARYLCPHPHDKKNNNPFLSETVSPDISVGAKEILQVIGYSNEESTEQKKEHIKLLLFNVKTKLLDCHSNLSLDNVVKSLARNLYELNFPPCENTITLKRNVVPDCTNTTETRVLNCKKKIPLKVNLDRKQLLPNCDFVYTNEIYDHAYISTT